MPPSSRPSSSDVIRMKVPSSVYNGSKLKAIKYTVEYIVHDINVHGSEGLQSPLFHIGNEDEYQARITFFPNARCDAADCCQLRGCSFVQFLSLTGIKPKHDVNIGLSYIHSSNIGDKTCIRVAPESAMRLFNKGCTPPWGMCFHVEMVRPSSYTWLNSGTLTLVCDITLPVTLSTTQVDPENKCKIPVNQTLLLEDISSLLHKSEFSDIDISVCGKTLKAHKLILSTRSPVFAKMFQTEMLESKLSVVEITDMKYEVVQSLLVYLYTDAVPSLDAHAEDLLAAAEKYQLDGLKRTCEAALARALKAQNAARLFVLADLHRAKTLKARAVDFIRENWQSIEGTDDWQLAKQTHLLEMAALFL